ncbi:hypothetical protein BVRB_2g025010 [Beta vulgaris subsp. vulgaris]|nr:hypothetical protein BVRB_2g025010 [Beta vulgaris subsp. vulgaris]
MIRQRFGGDCYTSRCLLMQHHQDSHAHLPWLPPFFFLFF